jgi:hypothetical protein
MHALLLRAPTPAVVCPAAQRVHVVVALATAEYVPTCGGGHHQHHET